MQSKTMKLALIPTIAVGLAVGLIAAMFALPSTTGASGGDYEVTITNISNVDLTPPIVALTKKKVDAIFTLGESASGALEHLAEGGDTSLLQTYFDDNNASVATHNGLIAPGESVTLMVEGNKNGYLYFASMLLPTNDAFTALNGEKVRGQKDRTFYANTYDAGTEMNDEMCASIPGPLCGGEPFNADRNDVNFVHPHPGIHGEGDISAQMYNWQDPTVKITVSRVK